MWYIWLIIAGVCFVIEMLTVGFFVFWFGIGALLTMLVSLISPNNWLLQSTVFIISSTLLIFLTKPLVDKFTKKDKKVATNAFSIIGKKGIVIKKMDNASPIGQVKVNGELWSAIKSDKDKTINVGESVIIEKIDGVKLLVRKP